MVIFVHRACNIMKCVSRLTLKDNFRSNLKFLYSMVEANFKIQMFKSAPGIELTSIFRTKSKMVKLDHFKRGINGK